MLKNLEVTKWLFAASGRHIFLWPKDTAVKDIAVKDTAVKDIAVKDTAVESS